MILAMAGVNYLLAVVYRRRIPAMKLELSDPWSSVAPAGFVEAKRGASPWKNGNVDTT